MQTNSPCWADLLQINCVGLDLLQINCMGLDLLSLFAAEAGAISVLGLQIEQNLRLFEFGSLKN